jgi:hypothetical protein
MEKAARERARLAAVRPTPVEPLPVRAVPLDADPLQRRANAVFDVLGLIERAEAIGFPERRGSTLRAAVERPDLTPRTLTRLERRIRAWMARHRPHGR